MRCMAEAVVETAQHQTVFSVLQWSIVEQVSKPQDILAKRVRILQR